MEPLSLVHVAAALYSVLVGAVVLRIKKGTVLHTWLGRSFVVAMICTDISAFGFLSTYGWTWFHTLGVWNLAYICIGLWYAFRRPSPTWVVQHFYYFSYAYLGVLAAAGARVPMFFGEDITTSTFLAIGVIFFAGAFLVEKVGKRLRSQYSDHTSKCAA